MLATLSSKATSTKNLVLFYLLYYLYVLVANSVIKYIPNILHGFITPTFITSSFGNIIVLLFITGYCGIRIKDLGLKSNLSSGILYFTLLFIVTQIVFFLGSIVMSGGIFLNSGWHRLGYYEVIGLLLGQIFGNSFLEEISYRTFLFPQIMIKISKKRFALIYSIVLSQILFALMHIPNQFIIRNHQSPADLALWLLSIFALGVILCIVYITTENLFIIVGLHALFNEPTIVFGEGFGDMLNTSIVVILGVLISLLFKKVKI